MSTSLLSSTPNFQPILDRALKEYRKRTGKELITHPLAEEIASCDSPKAILAVLQGKANELNQSQSGDERLTKWLTPTVNVLNALSATLGEGVGVSPYQDDIFRNQYLPCAARDTAASRDALIELFDRIEDFFVRLQTYTEVPPTTEMTNEMKQRPIKTFLKKVVGRNDIGDALQRLHMLEQGELRTVTAQMLKTTSDLKHDAKEIKVTVQKIGSGFSRDLRGWLTPPDPSTNHNIACGAQHKRTTAWIFNQGIFKEWESSSSLLWIHGKPGSGKSVLWFDILLCLHMPKLMPSTSSAIIQHIITLRDAKSAFVAYFYFDFRDCQ
ncbi:hypothetical protein EDB84DRAFT_1566957 [Lactarius hengduanensis]|nr:hypothetical protein EDB84DRAFT_1566957 [Lactarius hengduanensis]